MRPRALGRTVNSKLSCVWAQSRCTAGSTAQKSLQDRFGNQTSVQVREQVQRAGRGVGSTESAPCTIFKASVTARLGGFSVTVASASDPTSADEAKAAVINLALASDIDSLTSDNEPIFDKLRYLALGLGRMLRFSISFANQDQTSETDPSNSIVCRAYEKDDWFLGHQFRHRLAASGETPRAAFLAALYGVAAQYQNEVDASPKALEDIAELQRSLALSRKTVSTPTIKKNVEGSKTTFTASVTVSDALGNEYSVSSGPVATSYAACRSCALQVYKHEDNSPTFTILNRIKWQVDGMADELLRVEETERMVASRRDGGNWRIAPGSSEWDSEPEISSDVQQVGDNGYEATVYYGNTIIARCCNEGDYSAELGAFATACDAFISRHPDQVPASRYMFKTVNDLRRDFLQYAQFSAVDALKGATVSAYAVLGQCCSKHFNQFYGVTYTTLDAETHTCTVHVEDPSTRGKRVIGEATAKTKGQAWKNACINALTFNFPAQFREVQDRQDFNSSNAGAKASRADSKEMLLRAIAKLPLEDRVEKAPNLLALVEACAFTQRGWRQVNVYTEQDAQGNWKASLRRRDERNGKWVLISESIPIGSKKDATKLATYAAAREFFRPELDAYLALGRSDITQAEVEQLSKTAPFTRQKPLLPRILAEIDPSGADSVKLRVERCGTSPRQIAVTVVRNPSGDQILFMKSDWSSPEHDPTRGDRSALVPVLQDALLAASKTLKSEPRITQLFTGFRNYTPPGIRGLQDLTDFLFGTMFGVTPTVRSELCGTQWRSTLSLTVDSMGIDEIPLACASNASKKESIRLAHFNAVQRNFATLLQFYRRTTLELQNIADEVLRAPQTHIMDGSVVDAVAAQQFLKKTQPSQPPSEEALKPRLASRGGKKAPAIVFTAPPPAPYKHLKAKVKKEMPDRVIVLEQKFDHVSRDHKCQLTLRALDPQSAIRPQLVGSGEGAARNIALHHAALAALDALFTEELEAVMNQFPEWAEEPAAEL